MSRDEVLKKLKNFYILSADRYSLKRIGLFGSVARGEDSLDSDIDIVVEFKKPNLITQAELMLELQKLLGKRVDIVAIWKQMNPRLKNRIDKEAIYV